MGRVEDQWTWEMVLEERAKKKAAFEAKCRERDRKAAEREKRVMDGLWKKFSQKESKPKPRFSSKIQNVLDRTSHVETMDEMVKRRQDEEAQAAIESLVRNRGRG